MTALDSFFNKQSVVFHIKCKNQLDELWIDCPTSGHKCVTPDDCVHTVVVFDGKLGDWDSEKAHKSLTDVGWLQVGVDSWVCPVCRFLAPADGVPESLYFRPVCGSDPNEETNHAGPFSALGVPYWDGAFLIGTDEKGREVLCRYESQKVVETIHPVPANWGSGADQFFSSGSVAPSAGIMELASDQ